MKERINISQPATIGAVAISTGVMVGMWLIQKKISKLSDAVNQLENMMTFMDRERRQLWVNSKRPKEEPQCHAQTQTELDLTKEQIIAKNDPTPLTQFLSTCGIQIKHLPSQKDCNEVLDQQAYFMGNHYEAIKNVYKQIKKQMNQKGTLHMNLRNEPKNNLSLICQFCSRLYKIAFLESYHYRKSPRCEIQLQTSRTSKAINFLAGQWLERYIRTLLVQLVADLEKKTGHQVPVNYIVNPQIILPNGDDFELDLLCKVGDDIFWIESKTGNYQQYVDKYAKMTKILGLDKGQAIMVLTDISEKTALDLTHLFGMSVVPLERVEKHFRDCLQPYYEAKSASPQDERSPLESAVAHAADFLLPELESSQTQPACS